jgi:lipopolysaccharide/colanic/teichoic acid biosynthesis glycosyltransferase
MKTAYQAVLEEQPTIPNVLLSKPNTETRSVFGDRLYFPLKRFVDICVAVVFLLVMVLVFPIVALAVYLDNPGPIFYKQKRYGHLGKPFNVYKFRSMVANADALKANLASQNEATGKTFKMKRDPRITRVGRVIRKLSLDEAPQMFNVLAGQISIVGPRPLPVGELDMDDPRHAARQCVRPGLMCYREIMGRSNLTFEEWLELDLKYIHERSLRVDVSIMLRAIPSVITGRGAF